MDEVPDPQMVRAALVEKVARAMQKASRPDVDPDSMSPGARGTVGLVPVWKLYEHMAVAAVDACFPESGIAAWLWSNPKFGDSLREGRLTDAYLKHPGWSETPLYHGPPVGEASHAV